MISKIADLIRTIRFTQRFGMITKRPYSKRSVAQLY